MTLRNNLNMTQTEFSTLLNIPVKSIRNWEQGIRVPSNYILELIANAALTLTNEKLLIKKNKELVLSFLTIKEKVKEVVLNPNIAPGVSVPVEGGFNFVDSNKVIKNFFENFNITSMDIVEYNPKFDQDNKTLNYLYEVINLVKNIVIYK